MRVTIISFGHLFGAPAPAHLVADLRGHFHNPAPDLDPGVRFPDSRVIDQVMATPGLAALAHALAGAVHSLATTPQSQDRAGQEVTLAVGCSGGHHRAPSVANTIADLVRSLLGPDHTVEVVHRDLDRDDPDPTPLRPAPDMAELDLDVDLDEEQVDIDDPIDMPEGGTDFALPVRPRSTENPDQARARLEALAAAWTGGFQAYDMSRALADDQGLRRTRSWILTELRRLEKEGRLECDDYGYWTWTN